MEDIKNVLLPLRWARLKGHGTKGPYDGAGFRAPSPIGEYEIKREYEDGKPVAVWFNGDRLTVFDNFEDAKKWAEHEHYRAAMAPWVYTLDELRRVLNG